MAENEEEGKIMVSLLSFLFAGKSQFFWYFHFPFSPFPPRALKLQGMEIFFKNLIKN
jgi:hypothetical protein